MTSAYEGFWPDPYRDAISTLERSYIELNQSERGSYGKKSKVITIHKDDTPEKRQLVLFESGEHPQLIVLQTRALEFNLFAYLGDLTQEQVSRTYSHLEANLPSVFSPVGPIPFSLGVDNRKSSDSDYYFGYASLTNLVREPFFEWGEKDIAFKELLDEGHWAHLVGLRPRAALDMSRSAALKLVSDTWVSFISAIRANLALQQGPNTSRWARPVMERVVTFIQIYSEQ